MQEVIVMRVLSDFTAAVFQLNFQEIRLLLTFPPSRRHLHFPFPLSLGSVKLNIEGFTTLYIFLESQEVDHS